MTSKTVSLLSGIAAVVLLFAFAMACINGFCFDADFYKQEYSRLGTASYVGVSEEKLFEATDTLLDYLQDRRDNLDLSLENGEEYYNQQEKMHMVDVKNLYQGALCLAWVFLAVGAGLIALVTAVKKKHFLVPLMKGVFYGGIIVGAFFIVLALLASADFGTFWTNFHHVFFTNDLWLMDAATCRMIRMFELNFFFDLVIEILITFLAVYAVLMVVSGLIIRKYRGKDVQDG